MITIPLFFRSEVLWQLIVESLQCLFAEFAWVDRIRIRRNLYVCMYGILMYVCVDECMYVKDMYKYLGKTTITTTVTQISHVCMYVYVCMYV